MIKLSARSKDLLKWVNLIVWVVLGIWWVLVFSGKVESPLIESTSKTVVSKNMLG